MELKFDAQVVFEATGGSTSVSALADTGCMVFAAAPPQFFSEGTLVPAQRPLSLTTVTTDAIQGGTHGAWIDLAFYGCVPHARMLCPRIFVYCATVSDRLILGWPFFVAFQLMLCPVQQCILPRECVDIRPEALVQDRGALPSRQPPQTRREGGQRQPKSQPRAGVVTSGPVEPMAPTTDAPYTQHAQCTHACASQGDRRDSASGNEEPQGQQPLVTEPAAPEYTLGHLRAVFAPWLVVMATAIAYVTLTDPPRGQRGVEGRTHTLPNICLCECADECAHTRGDTSDAWHAPLALPERDPVWTPPERTLPTRSRFFKYVWEALGVLGGGCPTNPPQPDAILNDVLQAHDGAADSEKKLLVQLLSPQGRVPVRAHPESAGLDVFAARPAVIPPMSRALVPLDIAVAAPPDTYARIAPRSGMAAKHSVDVGAGVVDADYRGGVSVLLINNGSTEYVVREGDRIAQMIVENVSLTNVECVADLPPTTRGADGFGSTGVRQARPAGSTGVHQSEPRGLNSSPDMHAASTPDMQATYHTHTRSFPFSAPPSEECPAYKLRGLQADAFTGAAAGCTHHTNHILPSFEEVSESEVCVRACECACSGRSDWQFYQPDEGATRYGEFPDCFAGGWGYEQPYQGSTEAPYIKKKRTPPPVHGLTAMERSQLRRTHAHAHMRIHQKESYTVAPHIYNEIVAWAGEAPTLDLFATPETKKTAKFFDRKTQAAFKHSWADQFLFLQPPFKDYTRAFEKVLIDGGRGIAVMPVDKNQKWFWAFGEIAVDWVDIPAGTEIFQDLRGRSHTHKSSLPVRVVLFDAHDAPQFDGGQELARGSEDHKEPVPDTKGPKQVNTPPTHITMAVPGTVATGLRQRSVRSVIDSDREHPHGAKYREMLEKDFSHVFEFKPHTECKGLRGPEGELRIQLIDNPVPKKVQPYRCVGLRAAAFQALVDKFKSRGMLREAQGDPQWISRAFVVPKPGGKWRLVIDYRHLNSQIKDIIFPLPVIEDKILGEGKNVLWSIFDLEDGFHQMPLTEESKKYTAFMTPWGVYEWEVLPMGLKTAPAAYQRMVSWCLSQDPAIKARPYIDDILHGTPGNAKGEIDESVLHDHYMSLRAIFACFDKHKLTVKRDKCHLFRTRVKFCGHVLENGTRASAPAKREAISRWEPTHIQTPTHLKGFLGLTQFYSMYMRDYGHHASVLSEALVGLESGPKKGMRPQKIVWTPAMLRAFYKIRESMVKEVILDIPDPAKPYVLRTDASDYAVGATLEQENSEGQLRPVAFFSRKLQANQRNWSTREKETYGLIAALHKYRSWIGTKVYVKALTDHQALVSWFREDLGTVSGPVGRRGRWHEFLSQFDIEVIYTKGKEHIAPDAMSRWAYPACLHAGDVTLHGSEADSQGVTDDEQATAKWEDEELIRERDMAIARSVTARWQAEKAHKDNEKKERLRTLTASQPVPAQPPPVSHQVNTQCLFQQSLAAIRASQASPTPTTHSPAPAPSPSREHTCSSSSIQVNDRKKCSQYLRAQQVLRRMQQQSWSVEASLMARVTAGTHTHTPVAPVLRAMQAKLSGSDSPQGQISLPEAAGAALGGTPDVPARPVSECVRARPLGATMSASSGGQAKRPRGRPRKKTDDMAAPSAHAHAHTQLPDAPAADRVDSPQPAFALLPPPPPPAPLPRKRGRPRKHQPGPAPAPAPAPADSGTAMGSAAHTDTPAPELQDGVTAVLFSDWTEAYLSDVAYRSKVEALLKGEPVQGYGYCGNKLRRGGKVVVPESLMDSVILAMHAYTHPGVQKLTELCNRKFLFPGPLKPRVSELIKGCPTCQNCKARNHASPDAMEPYPVPQYPFSALSMDFVSLPEAEVDGQIYDYCLVIVDRLSGYVMAIPTQHKGLTAPGAAKLFLDRCLFFTGVPTEIMSDNDNLITAQFFETLCQKTGIEQHKGVIYRPQSNGRAEAAVKAVVNVLRRYLEDRSNQELSWVEALPLAVWCLNDQPGIVTPYSPHRLLFGRDPVGFGDVPPLSVQDGCEDAISFFDRLSQERKRVQEELTKLHAKAQRDHLAKHPPLKLDVGDSVWVLELSKDTTKLDRLWQGPCEVLTVVSPARFEVSTPQGVQVLPANRLKLYIPPPKGKAVPFHHFSRERPPPTEEGWIVEEIQGVRWTGQGQRRRREWLVKWKGHDQPEWEPASSFLHHINTEWHKFNKKHKIVISVDDVL